MKPRPFFSLLTGLFGSPENYCRLFVIKLLYRHLQHHNDTMINRHNDKDAGRLLYKNIYLSLYCKGSKRLFKVCVWEGAGDRTETAIFWPPLLWLATLSLSRSPDAQPEALGSTLLGAGFLYCILSATSLVSKLNRGSRGPPSAGCDFTYHISFSPFDLPGTRTQLPWLLSWQSYIIVQRQLDRPLDRPLDLWNRMFDRHQAEITVMQFTGHSLPVRQSMSVPWEFFLPCPISSANFRPRDFLCH